VIATRGFGGARTAAPKASRPEPATPEAAWSGSFAAGVSVPPPAAVAALLLASLGLLAAVFTTLVARPALPRPVPFISLLERPG
jgi:hypothetical protein